LPYLKTLQSGTAEELRGNVSPAVAWPTQVNHLKDLILTEDPYRFQQWKVIASNMIGSPRYSRFALKDLKSRPDWHSRWLPLSIDDYRLFHRDTAIIHAYHMAQLEERTGLRISDLAFVLEFGGGYGDMCHIFHKSGFRGNYVLFDFPVLLALQKFYLTEMGISATYISNSENLVVAGSPALFIAMYSLSEAPHSTRQPFKVLATDFDFFFITYAIDGVDAVLENDTYFQTWRNDIPDVVWDSWRSRLDKRIYGLTGCKSRSV